MRLIGAFALRSLEGVTFAASGRDHANHLRSRQRRSAPCAVPVRRMSKCAGWRPLPCTPILTA